MSTTFQKFRHIEGLELEEVCDLHNPFLKELKTATGRMMNNNPGSEPGKQQPLLATKFVFGEYQPRNSTEMQTIKILTSGFGNPTGGGRELKRWSKCVETQFGPSDKQKTKVTMVWWHMIVDREKVKTNYSTTDDHENELDELVSDDGEEEML